jgi:nucleotide-binding universal stress UspA family protein
MFCKVVVPVDFNDVSVRPLKLALDLATAAGGTVVLLAVVDDSFPNPDILSLQLPWADYHRHLRDEARRRLEKLVCEVEGGERAEICVVRGHPARTIVHFAAEEGCDLIVMATHGTRGLQHALLGSVTDKVIRQVHCPVLVVRLHDPEVPDSGAAR